MSFLSRLNPVPSFPAYTGPYTVGTQEFEIPITDLSSAAIPPDPSLTTVNFRIFYPSEQQKTKPVVWLPEPQGAYWRAYARFLQASPWLASLLSFIPLFRLIFYTTIPASQDAKLLPTPTGLQRWPVMIFSHGLGGTKNAYSHICGSLASHGLVVVAPDHRDGSAPISFIRETVNSPAKAVDYRQLPHQSSPEVEENRNTQLKIRCWELEQIHDAFLKLDRGEELTNLADTRPSKAGMSDFVSSLDVHEPGKISWSGHSFGATTIVQFIKSIFHNDSTLYSSPSSAISQQIRPTSAITLLDLWTLPLLFPSASSLWSKPLPPHTTHDGSGAPPLAVLSEAFFKWKSNLRDTIRAVSSPQAGKTTVKPHIFYPVSSAHLSQSDFGPLFPWATKKIFKAADGERTLRLNVRAILENLRRAGVRVADTSNLDMEIEGTVDAARIADAREAFPLGQDHEILGRDGSVSGWIAVDVEPDDGKLGMNGHVMQGAMNGHATEDHATINGHLTNGSAANGHPVDRHAPEPNHPISAVTSGELLKS